MTRQSVFLITMLLAAPLAMAQIANSVTISSNPTGGAFLVDGSPYVGSQTFLWPSGTKHHLQFQVSVDQNGAPLSYQQSTDGQSRYSFSGWTTSSGAVLPANPSITVTADPTISAITMTLTKQVRLQVQFSSYPYTTFDCSPTAVPQPYDYIRPGVVVVNGTCLGSDAVLWVGVGPVSVAAYPYAGFVFVGWLNAGAGQNAIGTITINGPTTVVARFALASRVTFRTKPLGLSVLVDRTPTPTIDPTGSIPQGGTCPFNLSLSNAAPISIASLCYGDFDFLPGSSHVIGAPSPQYDLLGNMWVMDSFSNGLQPNDTYVADSTPGISRTIVANFIPGEQVAFLTNPVGLKLNIDGRSNWQSYNFAWGLGTKHTVSAADQPDSKFRRWVFKGWSNGGQPAQNLTVTGPMRWIANFEAMPQVVLQSEPMGLALKVNGIDCATPCVLDRPVGTIVDVVAPQTIPVTDLSRMEFVDWSDGAGSARPIVFDGDQKILKVSYQRTFKVNASGDPSSGAAFTFNPPSAENFFPQNSGVTITANAKNGYRFRRWDGDLAGTYNQGTLSMTSPHQVLALLDKVPFLAPAGIHSAAGITPDGTVAPGSLISINGESLAAAFVQSTSTPLNQGLGGVAVTVNNRQLPIVSVSPQEIRAQLSSDLPDGNYTALIQSQGMPDVSGSFTVARNSPGLFGAPNQDLTALAGGLPIAWVNHSDGTAVTADSPAVLDEVVTILGTGFGPTNGLVFDGFPTPASANYTLRDYLQVTAGAVTVDPVWAGAVGGQVGMQSVKLQITADMLTNAMVPVTVTVNGKTSNAVNLNLQLPSQKADQ